LTNYLYKTHSFKYLFIYLYLKIIEISINYINIYILLYIMNTSLSKNLNALFQNISNSNDELEIIFNNFLKTNKLDLESYNNILKYAKHRNIKDK